jgi:type VI secretion system protein ImpH
MKNYLLFKNNSSLAFSAADSVIGLTGYNGILPEHYSELVLERLNQKDNTLADFLDIFHSRIARLFYDTWEFAKYYIAFEKFKYEAVSQDPTLRFIKAASGQPQIEDLGLFYAGLLNFQSRPVAALKLILQDYFSLPVSISNYAPEWINLKYEDRARRFLGIDAVVGKRIWHIQNRFSIKIGPINYAEFIRLLPNGDMLRALRDLVRKFVGMEFDFSVLLILNGNVVPKCFLNCKKSMRLGWNTWLKYNKNFTKYAVVKLTNEQFIKNIA